MVDTVIDWQAVMQFNGWFVLCRDSPEVNVDAILWHLPCQGPSYHTTLGGIIAFCWHISLSPFLSLYIRYYIYVCVCCHSTFLFKSVTLTSDHTLGGLPLTYFICMPVLGLADISNWLSYFEFLWKLPKLWFLSCHSNSSKVLHSWQKLPVDVGAVSSETPAHMSFASHHALKMGDPATKVKANPAAGAQVKRLLRFEINTQ